ncbi:MAG: YlqD family protein, partial [Bacilli bacterium]
MKIQAPVEVKWVVTPNIKIEWQTEVKKGISILERELEQLQFQSKKLLQEASKRGAEALKIVQERIKLEEKKRQEKIDRLRLQSEEIDRLQIGDLITRGTVQTEIEIQVGD